VAVPMGASVGLLVGFGEIVGSTVAGALVGGVDTLLKFDHFFFFDFFAWKNSSTLVPLSVFGGGKL